MLDLLFFGWICDWDVIALAVRLDDALIKHRLHMLGLLLEQLVLLLHLLHPLFKLIDAVELLLNGIFFVHCCSLVFEYLGSGSSTFGRSFHHIAANTVGD